MQIKHLMIMEKLMNDALKTIKIPPHSVEAEQSVLGSLMIDNESWQSISGRLSENDFYRQEHRLIYRTIQTLISKQIPADPLTVADTLLASQSLLNAGGEAYLLELASSVPAVANISAYADIVRDRAVLRTILSTANRMAESVFNPQGLSSSQLLEEIEREVLSISDHRKQVAEPILMHNLMCEAAQRMDELLHSPEPLTGISTGFLDFDYITAGLQAGDLVIVAGRPSMGKTTFVMNIAENIVIKYNKPVIIFSMEMSGQQLAMRFISSFGHINMQRVRTGKLDNLEWQKVSLAISTLSNMPLYIDDTSTLSPMEIRAKIRRLKRHCKSDISLIVIDYLQLMYVKGNKENRNIEISEISRNLKILAKEFNVPVIALSQLNRGLESRADKRPTMSDLRDSGAIEQDADLIAFIYRDEIYNKETRDRGIADIIISKQRNGPTGKVSLKFFGEFSRFDNLAHSTYVV